MKKKYSPRLISGLLLSSVLLFTSCTKEGLQEFKENREIDSTPLQGQMTTVKMESVRYSSTVKPATTWMGCPGGTIKLTQPIVVISLLKVVAGPGDEPLGITWYSNHSGVLYTIVANTTNIGKEGVSSMFLGVSNFEYYLEIRYGNKTCWVPHMELNSTVLITIPGTSTTVQLQLFS